MKRILSTVIVAAALITVASATASPAQAGKRQVTTLVVGDSITAYSAPELLALEPTFIIDGVGGRRVWQGAAAVQAYLDQHEAPDRLVIALGANEPRASKHAYLDAVNLVPASTTVMFVLAYRDPEIWGQDRADAVAQTVRWARAIVADRHHSCDAEWREIAIHHPDLLRDGVHPTDPEGEKVWAQMVSRRLSGCP